MSSHPDLHAIEMAEFGFARFLESLSVVRFDPASQEAGRHRNKEPSVGQLFGFYPGKPAGEKVVPQFSLETFRNTLRETDIAEVHVPAGVKVLVLFASANRDPRRFPDADRFLISRSPNDHVGFGAGIH